MSCGPRVTQDLFEGAGSSGIANAFDAKVKLEPTSKRSSPSSTAIPFSTDDVRCLRGCSSSDTNTISWLLSTRSTLVGQG